MRRRESGFVIISAVAFLAGMVTLNSASINQVLTETRIAERVIAKQQALYLAEAGVDEALAEFTTGGADGLTTFSAAEGWTARTDTDPTAPCQTGSSCTMNSVTLPTGAVTVEIDDPSAVEPVVRLTGSAGSTQQALEVVVQLPQPSVFQQAIFGTEGVQLRKNIVVDSYDSRLGLYTPAPATGNRSANGAIRTNSVDANTVTLQQDVQVYGDVVVGAGSTPPSVVISQAAGSVIYGTQENASQNLSLPAASPPTGSPCGVPLEVSGVTVTVDLNQGPVCYSRITITAGGRLVVNGQGQLTLGSEGANRALEMSEDATLQVNGALTLVADAVHLDHQLEVGSTASLDLYVTAGLLMGGDLNPGADPWKLSIVYTGTEALILEKAGNFYGTVYAPNAEVQFNKDGSLFGAVVARHFLLKKDAQFHFDESLPDSDIGTFGSTEVTIRSWRQL